MIIGLLILTLFPKAPAFELHANYQCKYGWINFCEFAVQGKFAELDRAAEEVCAQGGLNSNQITQYSTKEVFAARH